MTDFDQYSLDKWPTGIIKIYCAGRIYSPESCKDYRDKIVYNNLDRFSPGAYDRYFFSKIRAVSTVHPWAVYIGPYAFDGFSSGHGSGHITIEGRVDNAQDNGDAVSADELEDLQVEDALDRFYVSLNARIAIEAADLVVAVIDRESYGTILEVGYALAMGKTVLSVVDDDPELWFCRNAASNWLPGDQSLNSRICKDQDELLQTLWSYVDVRGHGKFIPASLAQLIESATSPLEELFAKAAESHYHKTGEHHEQLQGQYQIPGTKYRADLAEPNLKAIVELDGHTYHSSKDAFNHDRKRQRTLEKLGWRMLRFTGDEVRGNPTKCVQETYEFLNELAASKA